MKKLTLYICLFIVSSSSYGQGLRNTRMDGYMGIWFELKQKYEFGDKYSGGLGTYTAKHRPMALYAEAVDKTFFVYGGTTGESERHLLCMIGSYDHKTQQVSKPLVIYDKMGVNDPHDNPSIGMDKQGYLWVFVSGRGNSRPGFKLKSKEPYNPEYFEIVCEETFTYPQIWITDSMFVHFFTKYTGIRELYFETSIDGINWSNDMKLAGIKGGNDSLSGHYQLSAVFDQGAVAGTFFTRHLNGNVDTRTNLYYLETRDFGSGWQNVYGEAIPLPVENPDSRTLVADYHSQGKNVYLKDMSYDSSGNPVCLYLTSSGHKPGPENAPYTWYVCYFRNQQWHRSAVCESDHNYDMGSIYVNDSSWSIVGPTGSPPQAYGVGGEIVIWESKDQGKNWSEKMQVTDSSPLNHAYIRRPMNYKAPFCYFWASGDPRSLSISELYFGDFNGQIWKLPYKMEEDFESPERLMKR